MSSEVRRGRGVRDATGGCGGAAGTVRLRSIPLGAGLLAPSANAPQV